MTDPGWDEVTVLAAGSSSRGDLGLRVRRTAHRHVVELVVNGVFAMDSSETSSERALAALVPGAARHVLIGGLGLGYTAAAVLERADLDLDRVDVVELEPLLVTWARAAKTQVLASVAEDRRARLHVADVAEVLGGDVEPSGPWDAILLDVDNGPDFLIHGANAALYGPDLLRAAYGRLVPGGTLAIWCQGPAPRLSSTLSGLGPSEEHHHTVTRGARSFDYVIYTVTRTPAAVRAE